MTTLSVWLDQERGRQQRLAQHLGLKQPVVAAWVSGKRPVPISHGAAIEQFTGGEVSRQLMFPNDWRRIWPELETAASNDAKCVDIGSTNEQGASHA
jgi:DNA-binding transcriptional regulator YdaS (Cro superfamily)